MVNTQVITPKQLGDEARIVPVSKDRKAHHLEHFGLEGNAAIDAILANKKIPMGFKVSVPVHVDGKMVLLLGIGDPAALTQEKLGTLASTALKAAKGHGYSEIATTLHHLHESSGAKAVVEGAILGDLVFDQYKSKKDDDEPKKKPTPTVKLVSESKGLQKVRKIVADAALMAEATNTARLLANTPANIATPSFLASEAKKLGKKHGFKVSVKGRATLRKEGFHALTGVAQGSTNEEQLITMEYAPKGYTKTIVVVGKGVTFDSGGISIKPGQGMWDMKYDKCGACNTIALMSVLERLGVKHRVIGITPCVENMPSGTAQRPGDIVKSLKGTTIEVLNTDAEGRLILADAIHYGTSFKPDWMCDMATLTGACDVAVGSTYVAVMSKDQGLADKFVTASRASGDKAWQLPQGEEYDEANKGTYADLQNISLTNRAGTAIGGSFVAHFAGDVPFAHLDIASKAWVTGMDYFPKGPTGAGTRIVLQAILDS